WRVAGVRVGRDRTSGNLGTPVRARRPGGADLGKRRRRAGVGEERTRALLPRTEQDDERGRQRGHCVQVQTCDDAVRESLSARQTTADLRRRRGWSLRDDEVHESHVVLVQRAAQLESCGAGARFTLTIEAMIQDLRFALRLLAKERWFSTVAVLSLVL